MRMWAKVLRIMIRLHLREFLNEHEISAYRLGRAVPELDAQTIYHYVRGSRTPSLKGLDAVIRGLRTLTDTPVDVSDLLQYIDDTDLAGVSEKELQSWTVISISNRDHLPQDNKATASKRYTRKRQRGITRRLQQHILWFFLRLRRS